MAEEESQPLSLQERIAALKLTHLAKAPAGSQGGSRPVSDVRRAQSAIVPTVGTQKQDVGNLPNGTEPSPPVFDGTTHTALRTNGTNGAAARPSPPLPFRPNANGAAAKPPTPRLPPRSPNPATTSKQPPSLPPRRPSEMSRKGSQESIGSTISTISALSLTTGRQPSIDGGRIRAPPYDPATLPALPPKRSTQDETNIRSSKYSVNNIKPAPPVTSRDEPPPPLPRRTSTLLEPPLPTRRRLPPTDVPPLPQRTQSATEERPSVPPRPTGLLTPDASPPPIPWTSRPDVSKVAASKERKGPPRSSCLACRDFTAVDAHAAKFPRETVPNIDWLAHNLTEPFPSATDKARVIFTWLHYNIDYNVQAFFNNNIKPSTPASTLATGLAVCEGYAGLYAALATKAGLACVVVGGHGKGFGYSALQPGQPCPPRDPSGHAWNAVRIDNGEWHLTDPCWGAGHVADQAYKRQFTAAEFVMTNEAFGRKHYPQNPTHFYRADGRALGWEEYIRGEGVPGGGESVLVYSGIAANEGFDEYTISPRQKHLTAAGDLRRAPGGVVRFSFERLCRDWDPLVNGKGPPYVYILAAPVRDGVEGHYPEYYVFRNDGFTWWVDLEPAKLGRPGDKLMLYQIGSVDGKDARGLTIAEWEAAKGRKPMHFPAMACWEII